MQGIAMCRVAGPRHGDPRAAVEQHRHREHERGRCAHRENDARVIDPKAVGVPVVPLEALGERRASQ